MKIFLPELEVKDDEGFDKNDIFKRKPLAEGLTNLLKVASDPLVLALDGQWGSGKTVFLKQWAGLLRNDGFPVIYFDAFAHDYLEDPFAALASEIIDLVKDNTDPLAKDIKQTAVATAKVIGKALIKGVIKAGTAGAINTEVIAGELEDAIASVGDSLQDDLAKLIPDTKKEQSTFDAFKNAMSKLPELLNKSDLSGKAQTSPEPVIFMIDELDRCRPDFALRLLERIKHFYSVPGIHIVYGANLESLSHSVCAVYGSGQNGWIYLQKFIQLTVPLFDHVELERDQTSSLFISALQDAHIGSGKQPDAYIGCFDGLKFICERKHLSLRAIRQIVSQCVLSLATEPEFPFKQSNLLIGLCYLKICDPKNYALAKLGKLQIMVALDSFERRHPDADPVYFQTCWRVFLDANANEGDVKEIIPSFSGLSDSTSRRARVTEIANTIVDRINPTTAPHLPIIS